MGKRIAHCFGVLALLATSAAAQSVTVLGWNEDGRVVLNVSDPIQVTDLGGSTDEFLLACTPAETSFSKDSCRVCADAADCRYTPAKKKLKPAKAAPDKKWKLGKDTRTCTGPKKDPEECVRAIDLGPAGVVEMTESNPRRKGKLEAYFRPDSTAVALVLRGDSSSDQSIMIDDVRVVYRPGSLGKSPGPVGAAPSAPAAPAADFLAPQAAGGWYPVVVLSRAAGEAKVTAMDGDAWKVPESKLRKNPRKFVVGARVVAFWKATNGWYRGKVSEAQAAQIHVQFDDGDQGWIPIDGVILESDFGK
ncbi:MAG: hypothetical protein IT370_03325 [Deltaproteobacteria bacterium]|nr:hypothetical protein [Deltaproteobacteria bacterium]